MEQYVCVYMAKRSSEYHRTEDSLTHFLSLNLSLTCRSVGRSEDNQQSVQESLIKTLNSVLSARKRIRNGKRIPN